jgi:5-methylcytosine-specific restriction endonuclease McrA
MKCKHCHIRDICERSKRLCEFCLNSFNRSQKQWEKAHPDKIKTYAKNNYEKNKEKRILYQKEFRKTDEYKEYYKKYQRVNREKIRNKELNWAKNNPEKYKIKYRLLDSRRRDRKKNNLGSVVVKIKDWIYLLNLFGNKCLNCGSQSNIQIDHVVPLSVGGAHAIHNLQPLCGKCNNSKKSKTIDYRFFADWT